MNDNLDPASIARLEQLLRQQIVEAVTPKFSGYRVKKPLKKDVETGSKLAQLEAVLAHAAQLVEELRGEA